MPITIRNDQLKVLFDEPGSICKGSRFDWNGQVTQIIWKDRYTFCGVESKNPGDDAHRGKGLFCEFGIDRPVGYDDCSIGESFLKIGVGLLTKETDEPYCFWKPYTVQPAKFTIEHLSLSSVSFICMAGNAKGYSFWLEKKYEVKQSSLLVNSYLMNNGDKALATNEYCHNFITLNNFPVDDRYRLVFSDSIQDEALVEKINPKNIVVMEGQQVTWKEIPTSDFFFSGLTGMNGPITEWAVEHAEVGVGIKESCDFVPFRCNLWGIDHVISPELFFNIDLKPGESACWQRKYSFYKV